MYQHTKDRTSLTYRLPMPGFEPGTLLGYTAPPALPLSYTDLCAPACWSHTRAGRKEKRYVGLAPWSEETVVSCHTLTVVPRATDWASLQRPRIYSPQAGPHNLFGLCWRTGPSWHFSSFRAVRSPVFPGCQQYLWRLSQTAFCEPRSAHSPSGPCFPARKYI